jgi:predicted house-cleaning noncanonical NTP pyrophosphatase (MazG superfamily)
MRKFYHNKLIRDRIPQIIEDNNGKYELRAMGKDEFKRELRKKLLEEAEEVTGAEKEDLLKELADVLEVIKTIADSESISFDLIEKKQGERRRDRGSFEKKLFLIWSDKPTGES